MTLPSSDRPLLPPHPGHPPHSPELDGRSVSKLFELPGSSPGHGPSSSRTTTTATTIIPLGPLHVRTMDREGKIRPNEPNPTDSDAAAAIATATSAAKPPNETRIEDGNLSSNLGPVPPTMALDGDGQQQQLQLHQQQQPERSQPTVPTASHRHRHRLSTSLIDSPTLPVSVYSPYSLYSPHSSHSSHSPQSSHSPTLISPVTPSFNLGFIPATDGDDGGGGDTGNRRGSGTGGHQADRNN